MTTGRINQVSNAAGHLGANPPRGERSQAPGPPKGRCVVQGRNVRDVQPQRHPRRTGGTLAIIQLPPLSPSAPVRTQVQLDALAGAGWLRHTALGWRVQTPWTTPTNGGFRGAAPSRNLSFRYGQRPLIHRLQQCRGHKPPGFGHRNGATTGVQQ